MVDLQVIKPITRPSRWVSSLTYPHKADGTLHISLDPHNLNKAIIQEHYKALTLTDITHWLSGITTFSKLDANDGFWSIHLDKKGLTSPHSTITREDTGTFAVPLP